MTEQPKIDLAAEGLLGTPTPAPQAEAPAAPMGEQEIVEFITGALTSLQDSVASFHIGLRMMNTRIGTLEKYVSYLLEKDPVLGPKMAAHLEKLKEMEAALAPAPGVQTVPPAIAGAGNPAGS